MSKKVEKMRRAAEEKIYRKDEWIGQDEAELAYLERQLEELELSKEEQKVVDQYIACREDKEDRMGYLLYQAGMKDARRRMWIRKAIRRLAGIAVIGVGLLWWYKKNTDKVQAIWKQISKMNKKSS